MIQRAGNYQEIACDECGSETDQLFREDEFLDMVADAKTAGWSFQKDGDGNWVHLCPDCRVDGVAAQKRLFGY